MAHTLALSLLALPLAFAAQAPQFVPSSPSPYQTSPNLGGPSNGSLSPSPIVQGKMFDRFIQIWLENTDFETANSSATFRKLAQQGLLLTESYSLTHPSEPNYVAAAGGDFFGMHDDDLYNIPPNVSTIVDLLGTGNISWASYQESMEKDGSEAFSEALENYHSNPNNNKSDTYVYYVRKHSPTIPYNSVAQDPARRALHRNFNDFAADVNASALPQWIMITPNLVNDAHDTDIIWASAWLEEWLLPLLKDTRFNDNKTLILLTFDENETQTEKNRIYSLLLGGAVPPALRGKEDDTYYTHYSTLSTVQVNWDLGCLGRHDADGVMNNVYQFVADGVGYTGNNNISGGAIPLTNISGPIPGPLNQDAYQPFPAPDTNAKCVTGRSVFVAPGNNLSITIASLPPPMNLTALNQTVPASGPRVPTGSAAAESGSPTATAPAGDNGSSSNSTKPATSGAVGMIANLVLSIVAVGAATFFSF